MAGHLNLSEERDKWKLARDRRAQHIVSQATSNKALMKGTLKAIAASDRGVPGVPWEEVKRLAREKRDV